MKVTPLILIRDSIIRWGLLKHNTKKHQRNILNGTYYYVLFISFTSLYYRLKYVNLIAISLPCCYFFYFLALYVTFNVNGIDWTIWNWIVKGIEQFSLSYFVADVTHLKKFEKTRKIIYIYTYIYIISKQTVGANS